MVGEIVVCKYCDRLEYWGRMMWLSGKICCRRCYKEEYRKETGKVYKWDDLDGPVPTLEEYERRSNG